jgi:phosphoribosylanthranilate isomerase
MMYRQLHIKVCGLRDPGNIEQVCRLGPDMVGYIFYPHSGRYVGADPDPAMFRIPRPPVRKVGVFVNEPLLAVQRTFEKYHLDLVQLHGEESPEYCMALAGSEIPVIKAFGPGIIGNREEIAEYVEQVSYFLFDSRGPGYGGTGEQFDWDLLQRFSIPFPFILSGGLAPEDASRISVLEHDWLWGVDLNSRFERSPGLKEVELLEHFMQKIRKKKK